MPRRARVEFGLLYIGTYLGVQSTMSHALEYSRGGGNVLSEHCGEEKRAIGMDQ
jgi:hypothetical protein